MTTQNKLKTPVSMCQTTVRIEGDRVYKTYSLALIPYENATRVTQLLIQYHQQLDAVGLPLPTMKSNSEPLSFEFSYCGDSIMTLAQNDPLHFVKTNGQVIDQMLDICKLAIDQKLNLDPHFRNFTLDANGKVWFVDIFPPLVNGYIELFGSISETTRTRIQEHLALFFPDIIAQHFLADWFKVYKNKEIVEAIAKKMIEKKMINQINYEQINEIVRIENHNHNDNQFWLM